MKLSTFEAIAAALNREGVRYLVALLTTSWPRIERATAEVASAIAAATPGSHTEINIP